MDTEVRYSKFIVVYTITNENMRKVANQAST